MSMIALSMLRAGSAPSSAAATCSSRQCSLRLAALNQRARPSKAARLAVRAFNPSFEPSPQQPEGGFERSIFESPELPHIEITVLDARDALETCSGLYGEDKEACFSIFGVDSEHAERYYSVVSALEAALEWETDPEEEGLHHGQERC